MRLKSEPNRKVRKGRRLTQLLHEELVDSFGVIQVYWIRIRLRKVKAPVRDSPWWPASFTMYILALGLPALRRLSTESEPPLGSIQSCSPSIQRINTGPIRRPLLVLTDKDDGDLEGGDAVDERHTRVRTGSEKVGDAVLPGSLHDRKIHDVIVHITRGLFVQSGKSSRGVLRGL